MVTRIARDICFLIAVFLPALPVSASAESWGHDLLGPAAAELAGHIKDFRSTLGQPSGLRIEHCGMYTDCFYNPDGTLHHWAKTVTVNYSGPEDRWSGVRRHLEKTAFITGGYAPLLKRQRDYEAWRQSTNLKSLPWIAETGRLNIRTLKIPVITMRHEADELWSMFQAQCLAASGARKFLICNVSMPDYRRNAARAAVPLRKGETQTRTLRDGPSDDQVIEVAIDGKSWTMTLEYLFPDQSVKMSAAIMFKGLDALERTESWVDSLKPYDPGGTVDGWAYMTEPDHLEAEFLPTGFMERLAAAEAGAAAALADARLFLETK